MTLHKINLKELNSHYIQQLQSLYENEEVYVEIWLVDKSRKVEMTENLFWRIIALLDWKEQGDDDAVLAPAVERLSQLSPKGITDFYDLLSEKLYQLDGEVYAEQTIEDGYFSADLFLYARCAVVANGKNVYNKILNQPTSFPKNLFFEALLELPNKAWMKKTGMELGYLPLYNYETGFNPDGWGEKSIVL